MTTSYASGQDYLARYDSRLFGDLVRDDGTQEPEDSLPIHPKLLTALQDAYGKIISSIVVGNRYTLAQLDPANLAPEALDYLKRLNCDLAMLMLKRRRGEFNPEKDGALLKEVNEEVKGLKDGMAFLLGVQDDHAKASTLHLVKPQLIPIHRNTIRYRSLGYYPNYPEQNQRCP